NGTDGPQLQAGVALQSRPHYAGVYVVDVLVGDQQRVRTGQRIGTAPHAGVDDQVRAVLLQADARMPKFRQPHVLAPVVSDITGAIRTYRDARPVSSSSTMRRA